MGFCAKLPNLRDFRNYFFPRQTFEIRNQCVQSKETKIWTLKENRKLYTFIIFKGNIMFNTFLELSVEHRQGRKLNLAIMQSRLKVVLRRSSFNIGCEM